MIQKQKIFISVESNAENIRAIKDRWCHPQGNDIIINSVISETSILNVNTALEDPNFHIDQNRVRNELKNYINALQKKHSKLAENLTANAPIVFEHNLHELHKWMYTLKKVIDTSRGNHIKFMLPCAYSTDHLFLFEAEGETSTTWVRSALYKRTDFLIHLLRKFVIASGIDHEEYGTSVNILNGWGYHARRITRTFGMVIARGMMHSRNALRHQRKNLSTPLNRQSQLLVIVRSVIHAEYFSTLLKDPRTICLVQDGLGVYPKVLQRAKIEGATQIVHCYEIVSPLKILKLTVKVLGELCLFTLKAHRDPCSYDFALDGISINMTTILKECMVGSLDTRLLAITISSLASKADLILKGVVHSELFTAYPYSIKSTCDSFRISTLQFAFATYEMRPVPDFIFADRFFCFSLDQRKSIVALDNSFDHTKICYAGNLLIESADNNSNKTNDHTSDVMPKNVLIYYSQPLGEETDEALRSVMRIANAMELSLKVVMHPREHPDKFLQYGIELCVLTNEMYIEQRANLFKTTKFAITRNSNVGYQLLLRDIPLINYLTTTKDALVKHEYYEGYPLLVRTEEQLINILDFSSNYIEKYRIFRKSYIERSFDNKGANDVIELIFKKTHAS